MPNKIHNLRPQRERERERESMSSSCKSSVHCIDSHVPVRATYVNLYKWPESDAEFVRLVTRRRESGMLTSAAASAAAATNKDGVRPRRRHNWSSDNRPAVVDSYSCRQMYLRSYTFSRKESAREKTKKCLLRVKERASMFACLWMSKRSSNKKKRRSTKKKKKSAACFVNIGEMRRMYCAALTSVFQRVMSCRSIP